MSKSIWSSFSVSDERTGRKENQRKEPSNKFPVGISREEILSAGSSIIDDSTKSEDSTVDTIHEKLNSRLGERSIVNDEVMRRSIVISDFEEPGDLNSESKDDVVFDFKKEEPKVTESPVVEEAEVIPCRDLDPTKYNIKLDSIIDSRGETSARDKSIFLVSMSLLTIAAALAVLMWAMQTFAKGLILLVVAVCIGFGVFYLYKRE